MATQASQAQAAAKAQAQAAEMQAQATYAEATRQQTESNRIATEQKSDRIRQADQELGTLRVIVGELGSSSATSTNFFKEAGYIEGLDLSRIESNRQARIDSLQASKEAAHTGAMNTVSMANQQANFRTTNALIGFAGSALRIGADTYGKYQQIQDEAGKVKKIV
jgi:hypothetical protein